MSNGTIVERLAVLEVVVAEMRREQADVNDKLDQLLALRNRGVGAFWLASTLFGTVILGLGSFVLSLFKGH